MSQRFSDKKFKKLEREWYDKLERKGFVDIENFRREDRPLKSWHSREFLRRKLEIEETKEYLEKAESIFESGYKFKNGIHRRIWKLHCEGFSRREIASRIEGLKNAVKHDRVFQIISIIKRDNGL